MTVVYYKEDDKCLELYAELEKMAREFFDQFAELCKDCPRPMGHCCHGCNNMYWGCSENFKKSYFKKVGVEEPEDMIRDGWNFERSCKALTEKGCCLKMGKSPACIGFICNIFRKVLDKLDSNYIMVSSWDIFYGLAWGKYPDEETIEDVKEIFSQRFYKGDIQKAIKWATKDFFTGD